jgi:hypothetical protein
MALEAHVGPDENGGMSIDANDGNGGRGTEAPRPERPDAGTHDLPPSAHPPARPEEPKPLDDLDVPALTEPGETKGG